MSADSFEKHAGKIVSGLIACAIIAGATAVVQIDKRLALLESAVARDSGTVWTQSQQATYEARIEARIEAMLVRLTRVEQGR